MRKFFPVVSSILCVLLSENVLSQSDAAKKSRTTSIDQTVNQVEQENKQASSTEHFELVSGSFQQGAMIYAKTQAGSKVKVLDRSVYVDKQGYFVFGLGRDAKPEIMIDISLKTGDEVKITHEVKQRKYNIQKIEGVAQKYVSPPEEVLQRIRKENASVAHARKTKTKVDHFSKGFAWPAKGPITGVYGSQRVFNGVPKRPHYGLDIAGPVGTPVVAPAAGTVTFAGDDLYYSGGTLIMDHGQGISSTFIHLSKLWVKKGDQVLVGQKIAEIGATGRVTGPHLDWRINWFNHRLDPELVLIDSVRDK